MATLTWVISYLNMLKPCPSASDFSGRLAHPVGQNEEENEED